MAPKLLAIAYGEGYFGFLYYHEIIFQFWFIYRLTKLLQSFIYYCSQYLTLQMKKHAPYGLL